MKFQKLRPRVINYSDYKHFTNENYSKYLLTEIFNSCPRFDDCGFNGFFDLCQEILDQHVPRKQ